MPIGVIPSVESGVYPIRLLRPLPALSRIYRTAAIRIVHRWIGVQMVTFCAINKTTVGPV